MWTYWVRTLFIMRAEYNALGHDRHNSYSWPNIIRRFEDFKLLMVCCMIFFSSHCYCHPVIYSLSLFIIIFG